jgi:hypothetical protein
VITVVGGVYGERCSLPAWDFVYGSGGRAAACISTRTTTQLFTLLSNELKPDFEQILQAYDIHLRPTAHEYTVNFDYLHPLSSPYILKSGNKPEAGVLPIVRENNILLFGMVDYIATVHGKRVVYDPQGGEKVLLFSETGSTASELIYVLNDSELVRAAGETDLAIAADILLRGENAFAVIVKMGPLGAKIFSSEGESFDIPAYRSRRVFKIGSGDVFSAAFAYYWMEGQQSPQSAADLASRSVAAYAETREPYIAPAAEQDRNLIAVRQSAPGQIYLAAPFFSLEQLWLVEETRVILEALGATVFSPLHVVGFGRPKEIAPKDLSGLDSSVSVLAIMNGSDAGTVFEIGYAVAKRKKISIYADRNLTSDLTMVIGTDCSVFADYCSAVYTAIWDACD